MELVLRINIDKKHATLTTYDEQGKEVERVDHIKEFTLQNFTDDGIMPGKDFMIAGTAMSIEGQEVRLQRFMNKDHIRFSELKAKLEGDTRKHPDDNGLRVHSQFKADAPNTENSKPGVLGFMNDVVIRQQPRGR